MDAPTPLYIYWHVTLSQHAPIDYITAIQYSRWRAQDQEEKRRHLQGGHSPSHRSAHIHDNTSFIEWSVAVASDGEGRLLASRDC